MSKPGRTLRTLFALAVLGGAGSGIYAAQQTAPSTADGIAYLRKDGYANVTPTANPAVTGCPKNTRPHTFMTTARTGQQAKQTLCFGLFHKIYRPAF